jgi:FtsH-binding integral membrane protein
MGAEPSFQTGFEELGHDLKRFIETRYEMLRAELSASLAKVRSAAILFAIAAVLAVPAIILLGVCVSLAIALAFGAFQNQVGLIWGFLVTGAGGLCLAGIFGAIGKARLNAGDLAPKRTLRVLKNDRDTFRQGV